MIAELCRQIADATLAGADLRAIEEAVVDRAPVDEDVRAALWLYAEALQGLRPATIGSGAPSPRPNAPTWN